MDTTSRATAAALAAVALLASACATATDTAGPSPSPTTEPSATASETEPTVAPSATPTGSASEEPGAALVTSTGDACGGLTEPPPLMEPTITFVLDGQLHEIPRAGGRSTCLADDVDGPITWGAQGDRVAVGAHLLVAGSAGPATALTTGARMGFTRPTGTSTVSIQDDGRVLAKTSVDDGAVTDISFLADHDEALYYPSGTHVFAVGTHDDGRYGIWLATNAGADATLLSEPGPGVTVHGLGVDPQGVHLTFAADHGDEHHVHKVRMLGESLAEGNDEAAAETLVTSDEPLGDPVAWIDGWAVAVARSSCDSGGRALDLWHDGEVGPGRFRVDELPDGDTVPVGWLSFGELLVAVAPEGCVGSDAAALWILRADEEPQLVVSGVTAAALRWRDGDAPPPPSENFSGFA